MFSSRYLIHRDKLLSVVSSSNELLNLHTTYPISNIEQ